MERIRNTLKFRAIFAVLSCPGLSFLAGFLVAYNEPAFEGAKGYAFIFSAVLALPIIFTAVLMTKTHRLLLVWALLSVAGIALVSI